VLAWLLLSGPRAIAQEPAADRPAGPAAPAVAPATPAPPATPGPPAAPTPIETRLDVHGFKVVEAYSGAVSYYRIIEDPLEPFIRATYHPKMETVTLGYQIPDELRSHPSKLRWKWRAMVLPRNGDECAWGMSDSSAVVYVSWKRGLKWYSIKYVWSSVGKKGQVCDQRRNLFVVQDTVILESGGPTGIWKTEEIDPRKEFISHFEDGNPDADVPDFIGVGIMSDGDQTQSVSAADYAAFAVLH
jgi:hypothetical protein